MSRICEMCDKKALMGATRSHSNIATKHKRYVNLQIKHIDGKKVKICTTCIKTLAKKKK